LEEKKKNVSILSVQIERERESKLSLEFGTTRVEPRLE